MKIHNGKVHSLNIHFRLCDFPAKDMETLNLHLKTCEYNECEHVAKNISSIKKHMSISKDCIARTVNHIKIDRNDDEEAATKEYEQDELFR